MWEWQYTLKLQWQFSNLHCVVVYSLRSGGGSCMWRQKWCGCSCETGVVILMTSNYSVVRTGGVIPSSHCHKYSTGTQATCTAWRESIYDGGIIVC